MAKIDCACDLDGDWWMCLDGRVYGPCEWQEDDHACGGVCELKGDCRHSCHGVSLERDWARPYGSRW